MTDRSIHVSEYILKKLHDAWNGIWFKLGATTLITIPVTLLGIDTKIILVFVSLFILDFVSGIIRSVAIGNKLTSLKAFDSVIKGSMYLVFILSSWLVTLVFNEYIPFHVGAVTLGIVIEFRSILENIRDAKISIPLLSQILEWADHALEGLVSKIKQ